LLLEIFCFRIIIEIYVTNCNIKDMLYQANYVKCYKGGGFVL